MATLQFDELEVYKASEQLADLIWRIVEKWDNFNRDTTENRLFGPLTASVPTSRKGAGEEVTKTTNAS